MLSSAHCSPAGHVPPQVMMPHCPHVGGGPTHAHSPFVSSPHVWPFVQTPLAKHAGSTGSHSGSVVVVLVVGHRVQKPPLHPNPEKHVVPPQHGVPKEPQVVVVVVLVVVVGGVHGGSAGFVQEQNVSPLISHCSVTDFLQALKSAPVKAPHADPISSAQGFEPQSGGAALAPETKTPAVSATAANVTTALLIIVGPPHGRSHAPIDFGALPARATSSTSLSMDQAKTPAARLSAPPAPSWIVCGQWAYSGPQYLS